MEQHRLRGMTLSAMVAAVYALLTLALPVPQYGPVQLRLAEGLVLLPFLLPQTTAGLAVGCLIANLFSPMPLDLVFGTGATLAACLMTARMPHRLLAPVPPVVCNAVIVGMETAWAQVGLTSALWPAFCFNVLTIALGEGAVCYLVGLPLLSALGRLPKVRAMVPRNRKKRLK